MFTNNDTYFEELEKLNAWIDIWIDEEDYALEDIIKQENTEDTLKKFFKQGNFCTEGEGKKGEWQELLRIGNYEYPIKRVKIKGKYVSIDSDWSHLLYAKLLRAKIQQNSYSNCYIRRLDDVATYLEKHLPTHTVEDDMVTRLTLMYLMELSAICQLSESQGYSERARRVIKDANYSLINKYQDKTKDDDYYQRKAFYEFYELWSRYNIGVAYFHQREYRKAVLEFNQIIWRVKKWKDELENGDDRKKAEAKECLKFFSDGNGEAYKGKELLLLPAKLYRAQVQVKLQLAYHSLDTLYKHEHEEKDKGWQYNGWLSKPKQMKAELIKIGAYQLLGRLDKSWTALNHISSLLVGENSDKGTLKDRLSFEFPVDDVSKKYPRLGERFLGILIEDHLQWLLLEGKEKEDTKHRAPRISYLIKEHKTTAHKSGEDYVNAVAEVFVKSSGGKDNTYAERVKTAFNEYWKLVEYNADNRRGYFQQVAKYLDWLAEAKDVKIKGATEDLEVKEVKKARQKIAELANELYNSKLNDDRRICDAILEEEPGLDDNDGKMKKGKTTGDKKKEESKCRYCDAKGIDLRRIEGEHYTWFTEAMLKFFNSKNILPCNGKQDKKKFVKRLLKLERKERDNLRINDLNLHYGYYKPVELLEKLRTTGGKLCGGYTKQYEDTLERVKKFCLLSCESSETINKTITHNLSPPYEYEKIMADWGNYFFRHLESPSFHNHDTKANQFYFVGLRRWNSSSPAKGYSVGGGYLLYHLAKDKRVDIGIAIDPGFDFVRNLFHSGFSLDDIDIVLISHAHVDHIRDFESIITLFNELKKRRKRERRVHVILSLGAYRRLEHIVEDPVYRYFIEPYIIDIDREIDEKYFEKLGKRRQGNESKPVSFEFERVSQNGARKNNQIERIRAILPENQGNNNYRVRIKPTRAYHRDYTYSDSFGFLIELKAKNFKITFGYSGDTKWIYPNIPDPFRNKRDRRKFEDIAFQYRYCDALVVHLGSLIKENEDGKYLFREYDQCDKNENKEYPCEKQVRDENHPYIVGMLRFISRLDFYLSRSGDTNRPLILIGEFGEELKGHIRIDFTRRLQRIYGEHFLPVDVGMTVHLCKKDSEIVKDRDNNCACTVQCVQCQKFLNIVDADFEMYGPDNALYCVCKTCRRATPPDVLQTTLRKLYEVGYDINTGTDDGNKHS